MRLFENSYDKKINKYIKDYTGLKDFGSVRSFLLERIFKVIPELRLLKSPDAVNNVMRWFFNPDGSVKNNELIGKFRQILDVAKTKSQNDFEKLTYQIEFTDNPEDFIGRNAKLLAQQKQVTTSSPQPSSTTPNGYRIIYIESFEEAQSCDMKEWCIGRDKEHWDEMVGYTSTVYLLDKLGSDRIKPTEELFAKDEYFDKDNYFEANDNPDYGRFGSGEYPYDEYGLSKMVVIIRDDGVTDVYSRWNMNNEKDGNYLTMKELSEVLGVDARQALPYVNPLMPEQKLVRRKKVGKCTITESRLRKIIRECIIEAMTYSSYGLGKFDKTKFIKIRNIWGRNKPYGGLWASPDDENAFTWRKWAEQENFYPEKYTDDNVFVFELADNARLLRIAEKEDLNNIPMQWDRRDLFSACGDMGAVRRVRFLEDVFNSYAPHADWLPDFEKIAENYDVIEFKETGLTHKTMYGWDCDCILVLNPSVVMPIN